MNKCIYRNKNTYIGLFTVYAHNSNVPSTLPTHNLLAFHTSLFGAVFRAVFLHLALPSLLRVSRLDQDWGEFGHGRNAGLRCLRAHVVGAQLFRQHQDKGTPGCILDQAVFVQHPGIHCCHVQHVIKHCHWPPSCRRLHRVFTQHLIQHVYSDFCAVIINYRLRLRFGAAEGTCRAVDCAEDAYVFFFFLPW